MREFVDLGLAVNDLAIFAGDELIVQCDLLTLQRNLCNQITGQFTQLLCVQTGKKFKCCDHES